RRCSTGAEAVAEAERCVGAHRAGTLRRTGDWTPGQVFGHLAAWIEYGYEGYPFTPSPEAAARARANKARVLEQGMTPGYRIAGIEGGTTGSADAPVQAGLERLRRAWARLDSDCPTHEHAFFGAMSHEE